MSDLEKGTSPGYSITEEYAYDQENTTVSTTKVGKWAQFKDSFKPADFSSTEFEGLSQVERAAMATAKSPLTRSLKSRHLQMIAIGGSIGTGLFVGSGGSLSAGGPASVLIGFALIGIMLYCTVQALGELAVRFPVAGGFSTYATRFVDPAWGFAMGWNYVLQWIVAFPLELVAASMTIQFWKSDGTAAATVNPAAWVALFWAFITAINLFGVKGYGEAEFVFSFIKIIAVIGFVILGIVLVCGGGPHGGYIGGKYWHNPGAFANGFKGFCSVFVNAAFAFSGTELIGLAAAETENPRKSLPTAAKQVFWRITLFYIVSLTIVGLLVPYTDPNLLNGNSSADVTSSPFVIAINNAGISGIPSVMNVVVLVAVLSVGNSSVYGSSRTIAALAAQGQAPKFMGYIDRAGRPMVGIAITVAFGLIAFVAASDKEQEVFNWLLALSALSSLFTWASVCFCHIRFRRGLHVQGRGTDELEFTSAVGVWGSWFGLILNILVLIAQFWTALFPTNVADAKNFFEIYLALPIVLVCYIGFKVWYRTPFVRAKNIDLDTGRREIDYEVLREEIAAEKAFIRSKPWWFRAYKFWC